MTSGRNSSWPSGLTILIAALLACVTPAWGQLVNYEMVTVGDAGNANHTTGFGGVPYVYRIGKYEVTIGQYATFLNAVAKSDPYGLYNVRMNSDSNIAGIERSGSSGSYAYSITGPLGVTPAGADSPANRPISYVSFYDAVRFANWMSNGQGTSSTETGAYTISIEAVTAASRTGGVNTYTLSALSTLSVGDQVSISGLSGTAVNLSNTLGIVTSVSGLQFTIASSGPDAVATGTGRMTGVSIAHSPAAAFYIPSRDEWYKAAFYSPLLNSGSGGYYMYATQSNEVPGNQVGGLLNQANYRALVGGTTPFAVTQSPVQSPSQNYLTNVGAFSSSASYYGTFDQSGNVSELNETLVSVNVNNNGRDVRGGYWTSDSTQALSASGGIIGHGVTLEVYATGFRLASPIAANEILFNIVSGTQTQGAAGYSLLTPVNAASVTKTGSGTVVFDAVNTYAGPTSVQQGVLAISNSAAISNSPVVSLASGAGFDVTGLSGGYSVPSGQTLAGSGTVLGSVTFGQGSTLSPGMFSAASGASMLAADMQAGSLQALVVPEPATLGLVGVGLGFLGLGALRRKPVA